MNLSSCGSTNSSVLIYASPSPHNQLVMHGIHDTWLVRVYFLICFGRIVGCSKYNICNILKNHKSYKTQNLYIWINLSLTLFSMCHGEVLGCNLLKGMFVYINNKKWTHKNSWLSKVIFNITKDGRGGDEWKIWDSNVNGTMTFLEFELLGWWLGIHFSYIFIEFNFHRRKDHIMLIFWIFTFSLHF